jgi:uncharacterized alpha-E superfamily protein
VDDTFCDPLELREDSQLGIPGLLQAVRKGNVAVANPLGSSILENTGLMAFMQNAFKFFLNEDPLLPMIATWWCGQKKEMDYVIDNLDTLVIKSIERMSSFKTLMGRSLSKAQKDELIRKIKFEPFKYVGQEEVAFSTSPVFTKEKLEPRFTVLRTYLVANKENYEMMHGGLTRCSPAKGSFLVSNQDGGISKDTWVESVQKKNNSFPLIQRAPDMNRKAVLPSRAAENLFWVGRYTQRVIRSARFIRIVLRILTEKNYANQVNDSAYIKILLETITHLTDTYPGFVEYKKGELENPLKEIHQLICNPERVGSILFTLNNLLKAMYGARDRWTMDSWRIIDEIENVRRRMGAVEPDGIRYIFSLIYQLEGGLLSFSEMTRQSMYRSDGHQNLSSYRSVYRTLLSVSPAVDLLFLNGQNPTSIISQLEGLLKYSKALAQRGGTQADNEISLLVFECYSQVRLMNIDQLMEADPETHHRKAFGEFCGSLQSKILLLSSKLSANYFSHTTYQAQGDKDGFQFEV